MRNRFLDVQSGGDGGVESMPAVLLQATSKKAANRTRYAGRKSLPVRLRSQHCGECVGDRGPFE